MPKYERLNILSFPRSKVGLKELCQAHCEFAKDAAVSYKVWVFYPDGKLADSYESPDTGQKPSIQHVWIFGSTVNEGLITMLENRIPPTVKIHNRADAQSGLDWFLKYFGPVKTRV